MGCCSSRFDVALSITTKKTPYFSLDGLITRAKVVDVYDGDTVQIVFPFYNKERKKDMCRWKCRLSRIDTPELRTKSQEEKKLAIQAREYVKEYVLEKIVTVKCGKFDKYGRLLVEIYVFEGNTECSLNQLLIERGIAKEYNGGKKDGFNYL